MVRRITKKDKNIVPAEGSIFDVYLTDEECDREEKLLLHERGAKNGRSSYEHW